VATTVSRPAETTAARIPAGVAPLRAGQGTSFLLRRLHSLSGIVPVGAFVVEHFISNAFATNGPKAYADQVKFLTGLPFATWLEIFGIYIPILYHGLYGLYIWWRGETNVGDYKYASNWLYVVQRWTGIIAFAYIFWHVIEMRFTGVHLFGAPGAAFGKVQEEFAEGALTQIAYAVGIIAASWHFAYGIFLFCAKWGIVTGERARKRLQGVSVLIAALFIFIGLYTMWAFTSYPVQVPSNPAQAADVAAGKYEVHQEHTTGVPK
jgi:succinate dehydrogenase / fumarate reductase, cytochrome b subunit